MGRRTYRLILAGTAAAFGAVVIALISLDAALEWDEAVYAVRARAWVQDAPLTGWGAHRPPALPLLIAPLVAATTETALLRSVGVAGGAGLVLAVALLAHVMGGRVAALIAAAATASIVPVLVRSSQVLTDVPSAALVVLAAGVAWWQLERQPRAGPPIVLVPALLSAAYYLRYGSLLISIPLLVVGALLWWRRLLRAPRVMVVAAVVGIAALAPHLVWSARTTGSALGVLRSARAIAGEPDPLSTLGMYAGDLFGSVAGPVPGVVVLAGVAWSAAAIVGRPPRRRDAAIFLLVPAFLAVVGVSLTDSAEPRFVIVPLALLVVSGALAATAAIERAGASRVLPTAVTAALLGGFVWSSTLAVGTVRAGRDERAVVHAAAQAVSADLARSGGDPSACRVVARSVPVLTWYSGCATSALADPPRPASPVPMYLVLLDDEAAPPGWEDAPAVATIVRPQGRAVISRWR